MCVCLSVGECGFHSLFILRGRGGGLEQCRGSLHACMGNDCPPLALPLFFNQSVNGRTIDFNRPTDTAALPFPPFVFAVGDRPSTKREGRRGLSRPFACQEHPPFHLAHSDFGIIFIYLICVMWGSAWDASSFNGDDNQLAKTTIFLSFWNETPNPSTPVSRCDFPLCEDLTP